MEETANFESNAVMKTYKVTVAGNRRRRRRSHMEIFIDQDKTFTFLKAKVKLLLTSSNKI